MKIGGKREQRIKALMKHLDERGRRLYAASEAQELGHGGISAVHKLTGMSRKTIGKGVKELKEEPLEAGRVRRRGGGRKPIEEEQKGIGKRLEELVEESTSGDPQTPLLWTCKSTRNLAGELAERGSRISHAQVAKLLKARGYSLQGNRKAEEGAGHPDRDAQFRHINRRVKKALALGQPVISVDTKKKELIGNYDNKGRQWRRKGEARRVKGHDFPAEEVGRAHPYGIYDIGANRGFVNIGTDRDTAGFAAASIRGWWEQEGGKLYPQARWLLITADCGGSNGHRNRLWKIELQKLSEHIGIPIRVCHFPPGTSKWNKVEHRLFSFISSNWRGQPLCDYETVVKLISATRTAKGLRVTCRLDRGKYPVGATVDAEAMKAVRLRPMAFHGEWNYAVGSAPKGKP